MFAVSGDGVMTRESWFGSDPSLPAPTTDNRCSRSGS
jgi:hypothetical protein